MEDPVRPADIICLSELSCPISQLFKAGLSVAQDQIRLTFDRNKDDVFTINEHL